MVGLIKEYLGVRGNKSKMTLVTVVIVLYSLLNVRVTQLLAEIVSAVEAQDSKATQMLYMLIGICVVQVVFDYIITLLQRRGMHGTFVILYGKYAEKLLKADYKVFTKYSEGQLNGMIMGSLQNIAAFGRNVSAIVKAVVSAIATIGAIGLVEPKLLLPIIAIYFVAFIITHKIWNMIGAIEDQLTKKKLARSVEMQKIISGFAEIRSSCTEEEHLSKINFLNNSCAELFLKKGTTVSLSNGMFSLVDGIFTVMAIMYAMIAIPQGLTSGVAMTVIMYIWRLMEPMVVVLDQIDQFSTYSSEYKKYKEFMDIENDIEDGDIVLKQFNDEIHIKDMGFAYEDSDNVLSGIDLTIKKGEKVGICGPSGGGKSTFLKLLPRFYDPTEGSIEIDGIDIRRFTLKSLRSKIGVVHQSNYIFQGTILENIKYGSEGATDAEVVEAAKKAHIYDFIKSLPDQFNTDVGPNGFKLSGGQQQRIAISRIFLADPDIILLDEATSALDNESEKIVQDSLALFKDKTIITIAHRLSTIDDSDKIVVIDNHRIVEQGRPEELMEKKGEFYKLHKMQEK